MSLTSGTHHLARPVDPQSDHIIGQPTAALTLVEYGSYACPHCRAADQEISKLREKFGSRLRYVFRHAPLEGSDLALQSAVLAECAEEVGCFWEAHAALMNRSPALTVDDLRAVSSTIGFASLTAKALEERRATAARRIDSDVASAHQSGASLPPTFFINGVRYDGAWDFHSLVEAIEGSLGHRVRTAAMDFGSWAPAAALLLGTVTAVALVLSNLDIGAGLEAFWQSPFALGFGETRFSLSLREWINDGLLSLFFLAVGLEVKRELTVGQLATPRLAALPIASALGGMAVPAGLYLLIAHSGHWLRGAGIPMPTDTAFAVAIIAMLGPRVPVELRVFLTAASIVDDIGTILVVVIFYSSSINVPALAASVVLVLLLVGLNRSGIYRAWPYAIIGVALWAALHSAGLHSTLAGILLAVITPTRPPANLDALLAQAEAALGAESRRVAHTARAKPSITVLQTIDAIHDRIESPADRLLRTIEPWSTYLVLPLFALANAGLVFGADIFHDRERLALAIAIGLAVGKPVGFVGAAALVIRLGLSDLPKFFNLKQVAGAGAVAGVGFTMSLFIAGQAFPDVADIAAAKAAIFAASLLSATLGCIVLIRCSSRNTSTESHLR